MGHSTIQDQDLRGENISTVGVDIGNLVLQRSNKEIIFRTWDFGGQVTCKYFFFTPISIDMISEENNKAMYNLKVRFWNM